MCISTTTTLVIVSRNNRNVKARIMAISQLVISRRADSAYYFIELAQIASSREIITCVVFLCALFNLYFVATMETTLCVLMTGQTMAAFRR
jgi:hypothetical protein